MTRRTPSPVTLLALATFGVLYVPMLAVAVFSVNAARQGFVWRGFTLEWYRKLFGNEQILRASMNTLELAGASTLISTILGTALAMGMARFPWSRWTRRGLDLTVYLPVVTPDIIFAATLVIAYNLLRLAIPTFQMGMTMMILGHVSFQVAFVALVVNSRLAMIGREVEEAARDLYASTGYLLWRVTLPLLLPGIAAGAMLALTLSLDDFVISFFTSGLDETLPIYIHGSLRRGLPPQVHALSTLMFLLTVLLVIGLKLLTRTRKES